MPQHTPEQPIPPLQGLQLSARFDSQTGLGITNAYDGFGRLEFRGHNT